VLPILASKIVLPKSKIVFEAFFSQVRTILHSNRLIKNVLSNNPLRKTGSSVPILKTILDIV
jgi:hypothetical protein